MFPQVAPRVLGVGSTCGGMLLFLAMEHVGRPLSEVWRMCTNKATLQQQAFDVVARVHSRSILHKDLAMRNFTYRDGCIFLVDWGEAMHTDDAGNERAEGNLGREFNTSLSSTWLSVFHLG
jgi:tRNA A-37 threonylcarbamoyl transferase component Bud32